VDKAGNMAPQAIEKQKEGIRGLLPAGAYRIHRRQFQAH